MEFSHAPRRGGSAASGLSANSQEAINDTVDIAGLPPGKHKVKIELVDANHSVFPGQAVTLTFTVPSRQGMSHGGQGH